MVERNVIDMAKEIVNPERVRDLVPLLQKRPVVEVADILSKIPDSDLVNVLPYFTPRQQGLIVSEFHRKRQVEFFHHVSKKFFSVLFENMPSDSRADFFQSLTNKEQASLLPFMSKVSREDVIRLSSYPPETAGGIMSTDFAVIDEMGTCAEAIAKVRKDAPSKKMIYYIYVVNAEMVLQGFVTLKDIILADPDVQVAGILHREFVYSTVEEDRELVALKIERYDLVAIPVVNELNQLVGIVHHDDAIEIIRAEHTEDLEKFMGIVPAKDALDYNNTPVWLHFKKRVVWIASLAVVGLISGMIVHHYESSLTKLIILALYMPMVADTGGNAGSQAATVIVRALALGQIKVADWFRVIKKEAGISILLALVLGIIAFGKILFLSWETEVPPEYSLLYIACGISLALSLQVITATVIGALLPLTVRWLGGDPAVAASPAITTIVDISGLLIYFGIATMMFF